ncbi:MAG: sensor histidine kinase [Pseudobdellovibrionaceae bacterium]
MSTLKLFSENIKQDLVKGNHAEVFRKCEDLLKSQNIIKHVLVVTSLNQKICDSQKFNTFPLIIRNSIYYDENQIEAAADIRLEFDGLEKNTILFLNTLLVIFIYIFLIYFISKSSKQIKELILDPLIKVKDVFSDPTTSKLTNIKIDGDIDELILLENSIRKMGLQIEESHKKDIELLAMANFATLAKQVAHDIRSPLSALNMVVSVANGLPEAQRLMIRNASQRINDIANDLLHHANRKEAVDENSASQSGSGGTTTSNGEVDSKTGATKSTTGAETPSHELRQLTPAAKTLKTQPTLAIALVDALVSEKRIQFRDKINIDISAELDQGYGLFIQANTTELSRVLSNLINNSVEAFSTDGKITVRVFAHAAPHQQQVVITISDNGKGIPAAILAKLGQAGVTHGKAGTESGSGLGVYHAKQSIEAVGGSFSIASQEGQGTTITLSFAKIQAPDWFVEQIVLQPDQPLVVCDDDISIHDIWRGRFDKIISFTSGLEMIQWVEHEKLQGNPIHHTGLFLLDYELLGQKYNGLDISEELQLKNAILVTSRYDDSEIRKRCQILGIQLIPKTMSHFVPIVSPKTTVPVTISAKPESSLPTTPRPSHPQKIYDAVLIDDDPLIHTVWQMYASEKNKSLITFFSAKEFKEQLNWIDPLSPLFIDSNLADNIKGEVVAKDLFALGFKNITITTGYSADSIAPAPFIRQVLGKEPGF